MKKQLLILLLVPFLLNATPKKRIELDAVTAKELLNIINQSHSLQQYMFDKKGPLVQSQISQLKMSIEKALPRISGQQAQHISKLLKTINQDLMNAQSAQGDTKTKFLESAFKEIVVLFQSYKIEAPYKVFFCNIGRSVWIQQGNKPQNPFIEDSKCGRPVN
jgi:hypothetical protein